MATTALRPVLERCAKHAVTSDINLVGRRLLCSAVRLAVAGTVAMLATSCSDSSRDSETPALNGPLAPPAEAGGVSIAPPPGASSDWAGSFSGLPLCLTRPGEKATITAVNIVESKGTVTDPRTYIARGKDAGSGLLFGSSLGSAPDFAEPYATHEATYADQFVFSDDLESQPISEACAGPEVSSEEPNLVLTFSTDARGGAVLGLEVRYEVDGKAYTTGPIPWEMTLCGNDEALRELCQEPTPMSSGAS